MQTNLLTRLGTLAILVGTAAAWLPEARAADATGTWLTEDGRARVRTELCGPQGKSLCGYIVWLDKPQDEQGQPRTDRSNPDPRKQGRPILGHQMLLGLTPNAEGRYAGTIYNGDNGKSYDVTVWSEDPNALTVRGCMMAVFCGSQNWTRVANVRQGQLVGATDTPDGPRADVAWAKSSEIGSNRRVGHPTTSASKP